VELHTLSGHLISTLPELHRTAHGHTRRLHLVTHGSGDAPAARIRLHSVSGSLHLHPAEGEGGVEPARAEAPPVAAPAAPGPAGPQRRALLERVARGELSVGEALAALGR
jgi:hypothetical protein